MPGKYAKTYNTDTNKFEANPNYGKSTPASNTKQKMATAASSGASGGNTSSLMGGYNSTPHAVVSSPVIKTTPKPGVPAKAPTPMSRQAGAAARSKTSTGSSLAQPTNLYEGFQVHKDTGTFVFPQKQQSKNPVNVTGTPKGSKPVKTTPYTKGGNAGDKTKVNAITSQGQGQFGPGSVFTNPTSNQVPFLRDALRRKYGP